MRLTPPRVLAVLAMLAAVPAARAEPFVATLRPADAPSGRSAWRVASLSLNNPTATEAAAVRIRAATGGPARLVPLVLPPGSGTELDVAIPAIRPVQSCRIDLLARAEPFAEPIATIEATIDWPDEAITPDLWHGRSAYQTLDLPPSAWSGQSRRLAMLLAGLYVAGLAGVAIFRPRRRAILLVVLAGWSAATAAGAWLILPHLGPIVLIDPMENGIAVRTRRAGPVAVDLARPDGPPLIPVYATPLQFRQDTLVIDAGHTAHLPLAPGEVRLFLPAERSGQAPSPARPFALPGQ